MAWFQSGTYLPILHRQPCVPIRLWYVTHPAGTVTPVHLHPHTRHCRSAAGLSYSQFQYTSGGPSTVSLQKTRAYLAANSKYGGKYAPQHSEMASEYWVNVTNNGPVDADTVVLGFLSPPGAGENGVPLQYLFGFQRVFVPNGATVTVYLGVQSHQLTTVLQDGTRAALPGTYKVHFGVKETEPFGGGYSELSFVTSD